tara:strand:- start:318 stop:2231 length:1914 start_codon:yes stop_codon:yes gene_type:complete
MDNILNINLETSTAPKIVETLRNDWIEYGTEEYKNLFPQFLIDLYYNSSTHSAIINATADMIAGESFVVEETDDLAAYVRLKKFIANANSKEDLHTVFKKCAFDLKLHGSFALNVIWSKDKLSISELYHVPMERIRAGKPNEMGRIDKYYISADWSNTRRNKPLPVAAFNMNDRTSANQLLVEGLYSPNMEIYNTPDYVSGCNWCLIDQKVAEFHLNNIANGFAGTYFISFANGVPSAEERLQIERSITKKFTGEKAAGRFILSFSEDKNRTPEITPIDQSNADKQYLALQELLVQNILTAHRVTSPMLMGIRSDSGLGNNAQEMIEAYEIYSNSVVRPFQEILLKCFKKVLEINDVNLPISIQQFKPVSTRWSLDTLKEILTQDEIREEIGLEPLDNDEETLKEEEEKDKYKMAKECDCEKPSKDCEKKCDRYEQTELDKFIAEFGEDVPEDWELIDEQDAEGEHEDFDFEEALNELSHIELASTGTARPNATDPQDGLNNKFDKYFRVRYTYSEDSGLSREGSSRDFCQKMVQARKVYRKQDILQMGGRAVNPGWGLNGADTYSIWLFKGGGNCHHRWVRRIYRTALGRGMKRPINSSMIVSTAKARSEGFYPEPNDSRVAQAPKRMNKKGFVNK